MLLRKYIQENLKKCSVLKEEISAETNFILRNLFKVTNYYECAELTNFQEESLQEVFTRRQNGEPLQYILNVADFMNESFYVDKNVLIPRQETELLVLQAMNCAKDFSEPSILDIGTGSGCISVMLAKNIPDAKISACDISVKALDVAKLNAKNHKTKISFYFSDLFQNINSSFDIIVSNPPYIPYNEKKTIQKEVSFEPDTALYAYDDNGVEFYEKIIKESRQYLNENGYLIFELGINQSNLVKDIFSDYNYRYLETITDLNRIERIILARKN